jgi:hypothetical protein
MSVSLLKFDGSPELLQRVANHLPLTVFLPNSVIFSSRLLRLPIVQAQGSLIPQRHQRIDFGRPPRGDVASQQGNSPKQQRYCPQPRHRSI